MELRMKILYSLLLVTIWEIIGLMGDSEDYDDYSYTESDNPTLIEEANDIIVALDNEESSLHNEDVVVVFGKENSDKSLLVQFITGENEKLVSKSLDGKSPEILNSDLKPILEPNFSDLLKIDIETGTPHFEFPAFSDHKTFANDLISKYYTWRIINQAKSLKFILTVTYSSENNSVINVVEFLELVKHTTQFIQNIKKFSNSTAFVVTNLENPDKLKHTYLINKIAESLLLASKILSEHGDKRGEQLVADLLTVNRNKEYNKIGILTRPTKEGPVHDITSLMHEKRILKHLINNSTQFSSKDNSDFNYTSSLQITTNEESNQSINALKDQIKKIIIEARSEINKDIIKYLENREREIRDTQVLQQEFQYNFTKLLKIVKSSINSYTMVMHDKKILRDLVKLLMDLKIGVSKKNFKNILNCYKYLEFMQAYSNRSDLSILPNWEMKEVKKFIQDSRKWYNLFIKLYSLFSDIFVQINRKEKAIIIQEIDDACTNKKILKGLKRGLLNLSQTFHLHLNETLGVANINKVKLEHLCKIYNMTLVETPQKNCLNNTLQIKGEFITFSAIPPSDYCLGGIKRLELFAFNTIFLDKDLIRIGEELEVVAIAPKWVVFNNRKIILDGMQGQEHKNPRADDAYTPGFDGVDGEPGFPGGPAGSFLGIGKEMFGFAKNPDGKYGPGITEMLIRANGGNGGNGQNGGNGAKGADGTDWNVTSDEDRNFEECEVEFMSKCLLKLTYVFGTIGKPNGKGGDGGRGGLPGMSGSVNLFLPNNTHRVHLRADNIRGITGKGGFGGKGGYGSKTGMSVVQKTHYVVFPFTTTTDILFWIKGSVLEKGNDGKFANNAKGMKNAKRAVPTQFPQSINKYKTLLRENTKDRIRLSKLMDFYGRLDDEGPLPGGKKILKIYDTLGLVDELQGLEEQFLKLHSELDFLPFYKSLQRRVEIYAEDPKPEENKNEHNRVPEYLHVKDEYNRVLEYLHATILSKICNLKDGSTNNLIVDIRKYLNIVLGNVEEFERAINEIKKNEIHQKFKTEIDNKINEAREFAHEIEVEIGTINKNMYKQLELLTNRTITEKEIVAEKLEKDKKRKELAKKQMMMQGIFRIFKLIGMAVSFCGPWGNIAGGLMNTALDYAEPIALNSLEPNEQERRDHLFYQTGGLITKTAESIRSAHDELWKSNYDTLQKKIGYLKKHEKEVPELAEPREELEEIAKKTDPFSDESALVKSQKALEKAEAAYKSRSNVLGHLRHLDSINSIVTETYDVVKFFEDTTKVDEIEAEIDDDKNKLKKLDEFYDDIHRTIMPMFRSMKQEVDNIKNGLDSKSLVALDMTKWRVQQTLSTIKQELTSLMSTFPEFINVFRSLLDKLLDILSTLINIYDRKQELQNQELLFDSITQITSYNPKYPLVEQKLIDATNSLEVILNANKILIPYHRTLMAIGQFAFPFGEYFPTAYDFLTNLNQTDTNSLVSKVKRQMEEFKKKLDETDVSLEVNIDQNIYHGTFSVGGETFGPFFTWKNSEHKLKIGNLLSGENIILKADLEKGPPINAVKFKKIALQFRAINPQLQEDLDNALSEFEVDMTHLGNSYYRCDEKSYIMTSKSYTFSYSFQTKIYENDIVYKVRHGDFLLSPYTFWQIQLKSRSNPSYAFTRLSKYKHQVDIALSGEAKFLNQHNPICDTELSKYYTEATNSISELDILYDYEAQKYFEN